MQRGFASFALVLAIVVTLLTVAGSAFLFKKTFFQPKIPSQTQVLAITESPSPVPNETVQEAGATAQPNKDPFGDWEVFQDGTYYFRYPKGWIAGDNSSDKLGHLVIVKNPEGNVWLKLTDKKQVFEFGSVGSWKTSDIKINVEGKEYAAHESEVNRQGAFVDLIVPKSKNYQILFGTGYPATSNISASLISYNSSKDAILKIISSLKIIE